jgi:hypothetical protein
MPRLAAKTPGGVHPDSKGVYDEAAGKFPGFFASARLIGKAPVDGLVSSQGNSRVLGTVAALGSVLPAAVRQCLLY